MRRWIGGLFFVAGSLAAVPAAWAQPYLGQILNFPYTFCPTGWVQTSGQLLPINTNQAMFSLLGVNYGGNGTTNFALPYLRPTLTGNRFPLISCISLSGIFPSRN